jgi:AcrR family transcriptional regulator
MDGTIPTKSEQKRQGILDAATATFARFGYDKTTLDDIGGAVKLNKASLYYYFKNKEEIFTAVILEESRRFIASLQEKVEGIAGTDEKIVTYLLERLRFYHHTLNLHQLSIENLRTLEPLFQQLYAGVLEQEIAFVSELVAPLSGADRARKVAETLLLVADGLKHLAVQQQGHFAPSRLDYSQTEQDTEFVTRLILTGLAHS